MQLSFNRSVSDARGVDGRRARVAPSRLSDLRQGEVAVIDRIDLPQDMAHRLMELGFLPGMKVTAAHAAPGGDPRVFRLDGTEIALRKETSCKLLVKS